MFESNWYILFLTAFLPLIIGYIWYHPKVFGERLAKISGRDLSEIGVTNNLKRALSLYGFGVLISYLILVLSVHQVAPHLLFFGEPLMTDPNYEAHAFLQNFLEQFGDRHRSFGHGAIHGFETGLFASLTTLGFAAFAEGQSLKKSWIHIGFWVLTCTILGGCDECFLYIWIKGILIKNY